MIAISEITTFDPEYQFEKELRNRVLRIPLGLQLSSDDTKNEDHQLHFVAKNESKEVIGCVLVAGFGETAKIRQMAVDEKYRRLGIGTQLLSKAEERQAASGVKELFLHARVSAQAFYARLGYEPASSIFLEVTIPHIKMIKRIA